MTKQEFINHVFGLQDRIGGGYKCVYSREDVMVILYDIAKKATSIADGAELLKGGEE